MFIWHTTVSTICTSEIQKRLGTGTNCKTISDRNLTYFFQRSYHALKTFCASFEAGLTQNGAKVTLSPLAYMVKQLSSFSLVTLAPGPPQKITLADRWPENAGTIEFFEPPSATTRIEAASYFSLSIHVRVREDLPPFSSPAPSPAMWGRTPPSTLLVTFTLRKAHSRHFSLLCHRIYRKNDSHSCLKVKGKMFCSGNLVFHTLDPALDSVGQTFNHNLLYCSTCKSRYNEPWSKRYNYHYKYKII